MAQALDRNTFPDFTAGLIQPYNINRDFMPPGSPLQLHVLSLKRKEQSNTQIRRVRKIEKERVKDGVDAGGGGGGNGRRGSGCARREQIESKTLMC